MHYCFCLKRVFIYFVGLIFLLGCGKGQPTSGTGRQAESPINENQRNKLLEYLKQCLLNKDEAAIFQGSEEPIDCDMEIREKVLHILQGESESLTHRLSETGEKQRISGKQFLVVGGTRAGSAVILILSHQEDTEDDRIVIAPINTEALDGCFITRNAKLLEWFKGFEAESPNKSKPIFSPTDFFKNQGTNEK